MRISISLYLYHTIKHAVGNSSTRSNWFVFISSIRLTFLTGILMFRRKKREIYYPGLRDNYELALVTDKNSIPTCFSLGSAFKMSLYYKHCHISNSKYIPQHYCITFSNVTFLCIYFAI